MAKDAPAAGVAGKKKWIVARYPKLPGELIVLGSILTDPEDPETSLTRKTGVVAIPEDDKIDDSVGVRQQVHTELSTNTSALLKVVPPNSPLYAAGVRAQGLSSDEVKTTVEAMNVSAWSFIPVKSYMDEALSKPEITNHVTQGGWSEPLFMIVGVATAGALKITEDQSRERKGEFGLEASAAGAEGKMELSREAKAKAGSTLDTQKACDFAYRVREFEYFKFRRARRLQDGKNTGEGTHKFEDRGNRHLGTMFGNDKKGGGEQEAADKEEETIPGFQGWAEDDIEIPDTLVVTTLG